MILLSSNFRILTERLKVLKFDIVWGDNFSSQPLTLLFYAKHKGSGRQDEFSSVVAWQVGMDALPHLSPQVEEKGWEGA